MRRPMIRPALGKWLWGFLLIGCGLSDGANKRACNSQADCLSGYVCMAGRCTTVGSGGTTGGRWTSLADMPTARDHLAAVWGQDGRLYALGGASNDALDVVEAYNPKLNAWTTLSPMANKRFEFAAVVGTEGRIYAIGGANHDTLVNGTNLVEAYDPVTNRWTPVANLNTSRYAPAAAVGGDGRIYVFGGYDASARLLLATAEVYDVGMNTWTPVPFSMATPRERHAAAVGADGRIYALGGDSASGLLAAIESFAPSMAGWIAAPRMPTARAWLAAATGGDGRIYALGGLGAGDQSLAIVEAFSPATQTWLTAPSMPTDRGRLAAAASPDGKIYAVGGHHRNGTDLATLEVFTPSP